MIDTESKLSASNPNTGISALFGLKINSSLMALIILAIIEILWFGPIIGHIGFYLDDWATYSNFCLSAQNLPSLISTAFSDARLIIRPLEAMFFVVSWLAFGHHPFWHHIANCVFEILGSWFFYLALSKLSKNRSLALLAGVLLLVYPSHDATHYWATANTITLSMCLYMFSLWQTVCAVDKNKIVYSKLLLAGFAFLASLLTYEAFLPLCVANFACLFGLLKKDNSLKTTFLKSIMSFFPFVISTLIVFLYQRVMLMGMAKGQHHMLMGNIGHFIDVIYAGLNSTLTPSAFNFFANRIGETSAFVFTAPYIVSVIFLAIVVTAGLIASPSNKNSDFFHPYSFIGLGALIFFASYSIYGITNEYMPVLSSIFNRINYGGTIGSSLIISGLIGAAYHFASQLKANQMTSSLIKVAFVSITTLLVIFLVVTDWGMSRPWITSWNFQQCVVNVIKSKRAQLHNGDSVLFAGAPRYVMWAPVFDGVWDFEAMLQLITRNKQIHGGVVSERMILSKDSIKDISMGYLCATYSFHHLYLLTMCPRQWVALNSADDFINTIGSHGADASLAKSALINWKNQLAASEQSPSH